MRKGMKPILSEVLGYWKNYTESHKYILKAFGRITIDRISGCWLYENGNEKKYGRATLFNKTIGAHVFSFRIFRGKVPKGILVCHTCDIRNCCNPYHLFLGTELDNTRDMISKGRQVDPQYLSEIMKDRVNLGCDNGMVKHPDRRATKENGRHISATRPDYSNNSGYKHWSHKNPEKMLELRRRVSPKGSKHGQAKLNETKVLRIKKNFILFPMMTNTEMALKYKVSAGLISHIRYGRAWNHVKLSKKWIKENTSNED